MRIEKDGQRDTDRGKKINKQIEIEMEMEINIKIEMELKMLLWTNAHIDICMYVCVYIYIVPTIDPHFNLKFCVPTFIVALKAAALHFEI